MSNIADQKRYVEQLRREATMERMPVSQAVKAMITFMEDKREEDGLISGIDKKSNPFAESGGCIILWRVDYIIYYI